MAYAKQAKLLGDQRIFELDPAIKKYTLRDIGFAESKNGRFILERPLDINADFNDSFKIKVAISADLKTFKLTTTSGNGLREVNLFKKGDSKLLEQLEYTLNQLQDRNVIRLK
ncbi:MAG: cysteine desulfurase [Liquorilactobacillus ghanensis]|jgi:hypothetical protein|uniref:Cysteine desulfurase n=1 Tax=Liquorilactobacillus ghanensis DSM 18630 TaxID=1423750 RepID=A0A0R1VPC0_9LACO|nr:cysteine desulfurase [Liquorilactobacillus ghanensis]KRM07680.1 hypothetical protein FC89_GL000120 [Liquorilactobacillus ghanensis DSM 18630]